MMGDAAKRTQLQNLSDQHKASAKLLTDVLAQAVNDVAFRKKLLENPEETLKAKSPGVDASVIKFISSLDSSQFESAMKHQADEFDAEAGEAEAEAEAEA